MKTIRFQKRYVDDIMDGKKRSTLRPLSSRYPEAGEYAHFQAGSRTSPPFVTAFIRYVDRSPSLSPQEIEALAEIYGPDVHQFCRIHFEIPPDTPG